MKILHASFLVLALVGIGSAFTPAGAAPSTAEEPKRAHAGASQWRFLESPNGEKPKEKPATSRPYVSGGGQAWKSRLRR